MCQEKVWWSKLSRIKSRSATAPAEAGACFLAESPDSRYTLARMFRGWCMSVRFTAGSLLSVVLLACSHDSAGPTGPPPPPPPPPAPTVSTVTSTPGPGELVVQNDVLYWVDSTSSPFKTLSLAGGAPAVALFHEAPVPENELSDGTYVYWISAARLFRSTLDGATTVRLDSADGPAPPVMTMDPDHIYWLGAAPSTCSPPCSFSIRQVPKGAARRGRSPRPRTASSACRRWRSPAAR